MLSPPSPPSSSWAHRPLTHSHSPSLCRPVSRTPTVGTSIHMQPSGDSPSPLFVVLVDDLALPLFLTRRQREDCVRVRRRCPAHRPPPTPPPLIHISAPIHPRTNTQFTIASSSWTRPTPPFEVDASPDCATGLHTAQIARRPRRALSSAWGLT